MSENLLQNGKTWRDQVLPFFIAPTYRYRPSDKRALVLLSAAWTIFTVAVATVFTPTATLVYKLILAGCMSLGLIDPLYLLAKGIYLAPGQKYVKPKRVHPEEFLAQVKAEVKGKKK